MYGLNTSCSERTIKNIGLECLGCLQHLSINFSERENVEALIAKDEKVNWLIGMIF